MTKQEAIASVKEILFAMEKSFNDDELGWWNYIESDWDAKKLSAVIKAIQEI